MSTNEKDVRKQQLVLLKYERALAAAGAILVASAAGAAKAADGALDGAASKALTPILQAQFDAMKTCIAEHEDLRVCAVEMGVHLVDGGRPKDLPAVMEKLGLLLGLG